MEGWQTVSRKTRKVKTSPYDKLKSYRDFQSFDQVVTTFSSLTRRACVRWNYYLDKGGYAQPYATETVYPRSPIIEKIKVKIYGSLLRNLVTGRDLFDGNVIQVSVDTEYDSEHCVAECFRSAIIEKCKHIQLHDADGKFLYHNYRPELDLDDKYRWEKWHEENICPIRQTHYGGEISYIIKVPKEIFGVEVDMAITSSEAVIYDTELCRLAVECQTRTLTGELMADRFYLPMKCILHPFAEEIWKIAAKVYKKVKLAEAIWPELDPSLYELMPKNDTYKPAFNQVGKFTRITMTLTPFQKRLLRREDVIEITMEPWGLSLSDFELGNDICERAYKLQDLGAPTMSLEDIWDQSEDNEELREVLAAVSMYASIPVVTRDNSDYCLDPKSLERRLLYPPDTAPRYFYVYTARHLMLCPQDYGKFEEFAKTINDKQFSDFLQQLKVKMEMSCFKK